VCVVGALPFGIACSGTLPPLRGQIEVGREAYAVVAAGRDAASGDLYAVRASGGPVIPITFSSVGETRPALSPDGRRLAFLRGRAVADSTPGSVWVMDLLTGGEREVSLPRQAGIPRQVGWSPDGSRLTVATTAGCFAPALRGRIRAVPASRAERAPPTPAWRCCSVTRCSPARYPAPSRNRSASWEHRRPRPPGEHARAPARWGTDSVAFLVGNAIEVRPLGWPGATDQWSGLPGRQQAGGVAEPVEREVDSSGNEAPHPASTATCAKRARGLRR
jgi:hypothetical protein